MTTTPTDPRPAKSGRLESVVEVIILIAVAVMAGAASFTHVHDWTMDNAPAGTGSWFGWANAMVSELIPLAAGLEARRRKAAHGKAGKYPVFLILAAVALSLTGQFGEARPSVSGWIVSAVPALGFLALVKLILSRPTSHPTPDLPVAQLVDEHPAMSSPATTPAGSNWSPAVVEDQVLNAEPATTVARVTVPAHLVPPARFAATNHQATTGRPITADELAARISVPPAIAGELLTLFDIPTATGSVPARVNGSPIPGGGQ